MEYAKISVSLLTYWLDSTVFLKEDARDVRTVPLCGNLQNNYSNFVAFPLSLQKLPSAGAL